MGRELHVTLRAQELRTDRKGFAQWHVVSARETWRSDETALLLCDVWDSHWCRGAVERLNAMVPAMNALMKAARREGVLIVHAPSDTMAFYAESTARERAMEAPQAEPPPDSAHADPPQPVDSSDGGSDTGETSSHAAWSRQHPGIEIDEETDAITDDGHQVYSLLRQRGVKHLLIMGVHTNMCVLGRTFGIKQMVRWGVNVVLIRDLTDTMYNPARAPYVSHDEGTRLVVEFIEKFWCPTVESADLMSSL